MTRTWLNFSFPKGWSLITHKTRKIFFEIFLGEGLATELIVGRCVGFTTNLERLNHYFIHRECFSIKE